MHAARFESKMHVNMATLSEPCSSKAVSNEPSQSAEGNDSATQYALDELKKRLQSSFSSSTKDDIATILQCTEKRMFLLFPEMQQQRDGSSCGLFALEFACTLAEGKIHLELCTLMDLQCVLIFSSLYWEKKPRHLIVDPHWIIPAPH